MIRRLNDSAYDSNGTESARDLDDDIDGSSDEWDSEIPVSYKRRGEHRYSETPPPEAYEVHGRHSKPVRSIKVIERVPPELLSSVFSHIEDTKDQWSFLMTCKSWFLSGIDSIWFRPSLCNSETLRLFLRTLATPANDLTLDYGSMVRRLNMTNVAQDVLDDDMIKPTLICKKLERLTLTGCCNLTDSTVVPLIAQNHGLQSVDITSLELLTDAVIDAMAVNSTRLQGLYASNCSKFTDNSIIQLAKFCPLLKRVKFNGCFKISDVSVTELVRNCQFLVELDLAYCPNISDSIARLALVQLPQLREFRLSGNSNLSDEAFLGLSTAGMFEKLRIIDLTSCGLISDSTIGNLVRTAPRLRNVVLAKCVNITDRGVQYLSRLGRYLHYLHLGHCSNVTDHGISQLAKYCVRLQYIDLASCSQITDTAVQELAILPKLRRIGLVKCLNITDNAIYSLIEHAGPDSALERVHLSYCANITLTSILHLVNTCDKLTHLSLTGVPPFMRHDLTQFCRPAPADFTQHQQAMFCVFSGTGVDQLRKYLNELVEEQTNINGGSAIGAPATTTATANPGGIGDPLYFPNFVLPVPVNATPLVGQPQTLDVPFFPWQQQLQTPHRVAVDEGDEGDRREEERQEEDVEGDDEGFTTE